MTTLLQWLLATGLVLLLLVAGHNWYKRQLLTTTQATTGTLRQRIEIQP